MSKVFMLQGSRVNQIDSGFSVQNQIPVGIYETKISMTGIYLEKISDEFVFPYKVYGLQTNFMDHIVKTYNETSGNLGVLLWGTKGSGKTVIAKQLCNRLKLPVIVVKNAGMETGAIINYLSTLENECILFLDEFEKNFSEGDSTILELMDGVYNSRFRKMFLLTSNSLTVNENLLGRPSRIRYVKEFRNLEMETINEYLDENLKDQSCRHEVVNFIDTLSISTIDILKSIVEEINIHGFEGFKNYRNFFNVTTETYSYFTYRGSVNDSTLHTCENPEIYSIDRFLADVDVKMNPLPKPIVKDYDNPTESEQKAMAEYNERTRSKFGYISYCTVDSDIKFSSLSVGDEWYDNERIVQIDRAKQVMVTHEDSDDAYKFYFIMNPNAAPSLYKKSSNDYVF